MNTFILLFLSLQLASISAPCCCPTERNIWGHSITYEAIEPNPTQGHEVFTINSFQFGLDSNGITIRKQGCAKHLDIPGEPIVLFTGKGRLLIGGKGCFIEAILTDSSDISIREHISPADSSIVDQITGLGYAPDSAYFIATPQGVCTLQGTRLSEYRPHYLTNNLDWLLGNWLVLAVLSVFFALSLYAFYRWRSYHHALDKYKLESIINRRTEELVKEKEKTDNLLSRVLPSETATELKETGKVSTQKFNMVTVLFSDIQGFTKITDEVNPETLIDQLDKFFFYFDTVVEKYRIEKIKTIGDAYMCAGGIPRKNLTNPVEVVLAALEMMHYMKEINRQHNPGQDIWDLRIGIDTGPVIAGVVGRNKLSYDIWGSTVNTASRMESSGEVGKINISGNTYMLVADYFICTFRGRMPIKNKGDIEMYFVDGIKPSLSENFEGIKPNRDFDIQLQLLRLGDLEEFILEKLEKGLPKNLYYHNLKHTVDVYTQVELIGRSENLTDEELLLIRTAALFHDAGHLIDYSTHEEMGVKLAREILPEYRYTERQIQIISDLILATKLPPKPKNLLEEIICDADLDYLGRTDFIPVSNNLYRELREHGKVGSLHDWNMMQMKFINSHQYFTNTARRLRNVNKKSQLENLRSWMEKNGI